MKNLFCDGLKNLGLTFSEPQGAYYVLMDVSEFGVKDDVKFCEWMTQHVGVAAFRVLAFSGKISITCKISFCKERQYVKCGS